MITELNLICNRMEFGHSNQAKTLNAEFDADLTAFHGISTVVVDTIHQKEHKNRVSAHFKSMVTKKLILIHFMIISYTFEKPKLKLIST